MNTDGEEGGCLVPNSHSYMIGNWFRWGGPGEFQLCSDEKTKEGMLSVIPSPHLNSIQYLVHQFDPLIFFLHLFDLKFLLLIRHVAINGDHHDHDGQPSECRWT